MRPYSSPQSVGGSGGAKAKAKRRGSNRLTRRTSPCRHVSRVEHVIAPKSAAGKPGSRVPLFGAPRLHNFPPKGKEPGFAGVRDASIFDWVSTFRHYREDGCIGSLLPDESSLDSPMSDAEWSEMIRAAQENGIFTANDIEEKMLRSTSPLRRYGKGLQKASHTVQSPASGCRYNDNAPTQSNGAFERKMAMSALISTPSGVIVTENNHRVQKKTRISSQKPRKSFASRSRDTTPKKVAHRHRSFSSTHDSDGDESSGVTFSFKTSPSVNFHYHYHIMDPSSISRSAYGVAAEKVRVLGFGNDRRNWHTQMHRTRARKIKRRHRGEKDEGKEEEENEKSDIKSERSSDMASSEVSYLDNSFFNQSLSSVGHNQMSQDEPKDTFLMTPAPLTPPTKGRDLKAKSEKSVLPLNASPSRFVDGSDPQICSPKPTLRVSEVKSTTKKANIESATKFATKASFPPSSQPQHQSEPYSQREKEKADSKACQTKTDGRSIISNNQHAPFLRAASLPVSIAAFVAHNKFKPSAGTRSRRKFDKPESLGKQHSDTQDSKVYRSRNNKNIDIPEAVSGLFGASANTIGQEQSFRSVPQPDNQDLDLPYTNHDRNREASLADSLSDLDISADNGSQALLPGAYNMSYSIPRTREKVSRNLTDLEAAVLSGMASNDLMGKLTSINIDYSERFDAVSPSHPDYEYFAAGYNSDQLKIQRRREATNDMTKFKKSSSNGIAENDTYAKRSRFDVQLDDGIRWRDSAEAVSMDARGDFDTFPFPPPPGEDHI